VVRSAISTPLHTLEQPVASQKTEKYACNTAQGFSSTTPSSHVYVSYRGTAKAAQTVSAPPVTGEDSQFLRHLALIARVLELRSTSNSTVGSSSRQLDTVTALPWWMGPQNPQEHFSSVSRGNSPVLPRLSVHMSFELSGYFRRALDAAGKPAPLHL